MPRNNNSVKARQRAVELTASAQDHIAKAIAAVSPISPEAAELNEAVDFIVAVGDYLTGDVKYRTTTWLEKWSGEAVMGS